MGFGVANTSGKDMDGEFKMASIDATDMSGQDGVLVVSGDGVPVVSGDAEGPRPCRGECSGVCKTMPSRSRDGSESMLGSSGSISEPGSVVLHE